MDAVELLDYTEAAMDEVELLPGRLHHQRTKGL